jgi:hypothetical protein
MWWYVFLLLLLLLMRGGGCRIRHRQRNWWRTGRNPAAVEPRRLKVPAEAEEVRIAGGSRDLRIYKPDKH